MQKGVSRTLTTDDAGEYAAPNLDPDTYAIRVEFKGFKTSERQGLQIGVGQEARIDFTLEPGEQTQTVTVTEAIPFIETTTATLNGNISAETITELPLNGRNYVNLLSLPSGIREFARRGRRQPIGHGSPARRQLFRGRRTEQL